MTDRLRLPWPDPAAFAGRDGRPIRLLAVSDEVDPALEQAATRRALGPIDLVLGAGDLEPSYLGFLADAFGVPLLYVRGNHDVGGAWDDAEREHVPEALADGRVHEEQGLRAAGVLRRAALRTARPPQRGAAAVRHRPCGARRCAPGRAQACGARCWCSPTRRRVA